MTHSRTSQYFVAVGILLKLGNFQKWNPFEDGVVYIYSGILLGYKKEWNLAICDNIDGPREY